MAEVTITRYCLCGSSMKVTSNPASLALDLDRIFDHVHWPGNGHGPASARQAAYARRRADAKAIEETNDAD
jgi:hypothetical protein